MTKAAFLVRGEIVDVDVNMISLSNQRIFV
jgi:hypothetical protein